MSPLALQLNFILGMGAVAAQVATALLLIALAYEYFTRERIPFLTFVAQYAMHFIFLSSVFGVGMSLYYSEVLGFLPCGLCWFQRIALYPQALIVGIALYKNTTRQVGDYLIGLSILGAVVGFYQHYLQMGGSDLLPCPASGGDCAQRIMFEFNYITFPLMSASFFILVLVLCVVERRVSRIK